MGVQTIEELLNPGVGNGVLGLCARLGAVPHMGLSLVKGTTSTGIDPQESFAEAGVLYLTMFIIVNIAVFLDWKRERMFEALT